ncbi:TonB-dependent receptor [Sphingosinicella terrae]|uniref:TonB-dependent receptor n=1 Tax=Sphingosinicella terrae TaxID=2172047 RepID=UPI0013B36AAF|nr:TonB-dependent receptor [Sphingosinicella terrae]
MDIRLALFASAAVAAMSVPAAAQAQASYEFNLPEQPLAESLRAVASRTQSNIVFSDSLVRGRPAPALRGSYDAAGAYRLLLRGSGLTLRVTDGGSYVVVGGDGGGPSAEPASGTGGAGPSGSIAGRLTAAEGGRNFAGALVRIEETGDTTSVDDEGAFRFPALPPGDYTLTVSFIGYPPATQNVTVPAGGAAETELALGATGGGDAIIVYGSLSARANALNLQRTAENSADVISADDLGNFTGTTFSDALRRAPGVSFQRDALTGDGTNIVVRGLEPDMNAVKLNGLNLPVGNGVGRSADLSNLLADSVSRITIHKTLLPSQDSAGTGGLVEIETLSPLQRPRRYANVQIEGGRGTNGFSDDFLVSGTIAGTFGADQNIGLSASVQYRENSARTISYNSVLRYGRYLPLDADGLPTSDSLEDVDPLLTFPFFPDAAEAYPTRLETSFNHVEQQTLALTLSGEWQVADHTNLKLDFLHSETERTTFSLTDTFDALIEYTDRPGGPDGAELGLDLTPGNAALRRQQQYFYDRDVRIVTDNLSFNGRTNVGRFEFNYVLGYARGTERHPRQFGLELRSPDRDALPGYFLPEATDPTAGFIISPFGTRSGNGIPLPLLSQAGWDFVNDPSQFVIENASGQIDLTTGENDRYTASLSARWDVGAGPLSYIEAGLYYERTEFRSDLVRSQLGGGTPVGALGFDFVPSDLTRIGIAVPGFAVIGEDQIGEFVDNLESYLGTGGLTLTPIVPHPDQGNQRTREETIAGYVQSRLEFGKLEIIGGARVNRVRLRADNLIFPTYIGPILPENGGGIGVDLIFQNAFTELVTQEATVTEILPRILFNYRESDNLIFRGGYYMSVARPAIGLLSTQTRISFINFPIPGPEGVKPILEIVTGNPDLRPATTHNFDLSVEHYHDRIGLMKVSGFYKLIDNLLQSTSVNGPVNLEHVVLPDHPYFQGPPYFDPANPSSAFITGRSPINSDEQAWIWGIEAQLERQFTFLPGALSGLGIYANYTFTESSRTERYSWAAGGGEIFEFRSVPFALQPRHSGTVALTYNKYGIDATLAYGFQSRSLGRFEPRGLSLYQEGVQTLDFRAEYYLRPSFGRLRLYVEASDLLNGTADPDVEETFGDDLRFFTRATYLGGRRFKIGLSATF